MVARRRAEARRQAESLTPLDSTLMLLCYLFGLLVLVLRRAGAVAGNSLVARRAQARQLRSAAAFRNGRTVAAGQRDRAGEGPRRGTARKPGGARVARLSGLRVAGGGAFGGRHSARSAAAQVQGGAGARRRSRHGRKGAEPGGGGARHQQTDRNPRIRRFRWAGDARMAARIAVRL